MPTSLSASAFSARPSRLGLNFALMLLTLLCLLLPRAQAQTTGQVKYFPRTGYESRMTGGVFQGSTDNTTWTTLYTVSTAPGDVYTTATCTANPATFRFLRYLGPAGSDCNVAEIEFDSVTGGTATKLTGTGFGTPGSYNNSGNDFTKALDGSTSTYFDAPQGTGSFVGIDQGPLAGTGEVHFFPRSGYASRMTGGKFQGSQDNTTYTDLYTIVTQPTDGQSTTAALSVNPKGYRYLRYLAPASSYGNVAEVAFYTGTAGVPSS